MKAKKKWKRLRKLTKKCGKKNNCENCKYNDMCNSMKAFTGANLYTLFKINNYLKGFNKV